MGGLERILTEVLKEIDKEKVEVSLFIEDDCGEENVFEKDIPKEVEYRFLKSESLIRKTESIKAKKKNIFYKLVYNFLMRYEKDVAFNNLKKYLSEMDMPDVIIDFDTGLSKDIHKIKGIRKIAWIHNSIPRLKKKKSKIERYGKRLNNYDTVVAICDDMKKEIENIYPYLKGRVKRIYNPFNFDRIQKLGSDLSGLNDEEKALIEDDYIVAVSRLDNVQKDYGTLLKAFKILKEKGIKEKLYIIGHGPARGEIEKLIEELGLGNEVKLLGLKKNPYVWMKNSKLFVHSSKYEGLPTVLIEAMILDRFVVSSNCPTGPREILDNGDCGILVPVGNVKELAEGIEKGLSEAGEYKDKIAVRVEEFKSENILREIEKFI